MQHLIPVEQWLKQSAHAAEHQKKVLDAARKAGFTVHVDISLTKV